jgi:DNA-directed RNA polymerase specialized sigma24 family protein
LVFVLREAFGFGYGEIAEIIDRSEASVRQIAHRGREHVQAQIDLTGVGLAAWPAGHGRLGQIIS